MKCTAKGTNVTLCINILFGIRSWCGWHSCKPSTPQFAKDHTYQGSRGRTRYPVCLWCTRSASMKVDWSYGWDERDPILRVCVLAGQLWSIITTRVSGYQAEKLLCVVCFPYLLLTEYSFIHLCVGDYRRTVRQEMSSQAPVTLHQQSIVIICWFIFLSSQTNE